MRPASSRAAGGANRTTPEDVEAAPAVPHDAARAAFTAHIHGRIAPLPAEGAVGPIRRRAGVACQLISQPVSTSVRSRPSIPGAWFINGTGTVAPLMRFAIARVE